MAQRQYDAAKGAGIPEVVEAGGSSIGTSAVRVTVDDANAGSKAEVVRALAAITARITADTWPGA